MTKTQEVALDAPGAAARPRGALLAALRGQAEKTYEVECEYIAASLADPYRVEAEANAFHQDVAEYLYGLTRDRDLVPPPAGTVVQAVERRHGAQQEDAYVRAPPPARQPPP